jgi:hypothetical protein
MVEQATWNKERVTSLDWVSYQLMRFKDHPGVTTVPVQRTDLQPTGSGEPPTAPVAAAIANALTVRFFQHDTPAGCLDLPHRPSGALACGPEVISASDLRYRWIAMGSACQFTGLVV